MTCASASRHTAAKPRRTTSSKKITRTPSSRSSAASPLSKLRTPSRQTCSVSTLGAGPASRVSSSTPWPNKQASGIPCNAPLACLLGHGVDELTRLAGPAPKVLPEHVCLLGVRCFESGEAALLREIAEYNPHRDESRTTLNLLRRMLCAAGVGKEQDEPHNRARAAILRP